MSGKIVVVNPFNNEVIEEIAKPSLEEAKEAFRTAYDFWQQEYKRPKQGRYTHKISTKKQ